MDVVHTNNNTFHRCLTSGPFYTFSWFFFLTCFASSKKPTSSYWTFFFSGFRGSLIIAVTQNTMKSWIFRVVKRFHDHLRKKKKKKKVQHSLSTSYCTIFAVLYLTSNILVLLMYGGNRNIIFSNISDPQLFFFANSFSLYSLQHLQRPIHIA